MPIKPINIATYVTPSDYMKFDQGETKIIIVSNGGMAKMHGMRTAKGFINLGICPEDETCEHCKKALTLPEDKRKTYEAKQKWLWIVYWKDKGTIRLLEGGKQIGDGICKATQQAGVTSFTEFEYIISATGENLNRKYTVNLGSKVELTEKEKEIIDPAKKFLINKHFK